MGNPRLVIMLAGLLGALSLSANVAQASFWQAANLAERSIANVSGIQYFSSDEPGLRRFLDQVPAEQSGQSLDIELPMPDGSMARYQIFESSVMEAGLAAKFPDIKSYEVRGIDFPGSYGRVDISPKGFRGMIDTPYGRLFIDPEQSRSGSYMARTKGSQTRTGSFQCDTHGTPDNQSSVDYFSKASATANRISGSLLGYRIAVSATLKYVNEVGGTLSKTMAEINTAINRVNHIYQRDLGIKLFLVNDNDKLIDLFDTAGFNNDDVSVLIDQNQDWIDSRIGNSSYDIGHIFGGGNTGGLAALESVCGPNKAQGATGTLNPTGDPFYIDYVAHEIGHQFGANHTFNGTTGSCGGGNRNGPTAYEPGGGTTIMAYAGICGIPGPGLLPENLQLNSDATFHAGSIREINAFVSGSTGSSCATLLPISPTNTDPSDINAGIDRTIPMGTTFGLEGSATDADGDTLSYQWDQMNANGTATTSATVGDDLGNNPLFRSFVPQSTGVRYFPLLESQINNTSDIGETLPTTNRTLKFRLTARDCKSGVSTDDVSVTVDPNSGPFKVTSHTVFGSTFPGTTPQTVTWDRASTHIAPINCANVDIDLLTFSSDQKTYAVTLLLAGTPNDGSESVTVGDKSNSNARFKVSCSDNIFYDISDTDLTITGTTALPTKGNTVALSTATSCGDIDIGTAVATGEGVDSDSDDDDGGGGGAPDSTWLLFTLTLFGAARSRRKMKQS